MSQVYSYRNTDKSPPKVVNVWRQMKADRQENIRLAVIPGIMTVSRDETPAQTEARLMRLMETAQRVIDEMNCNVEAHGWAYRNRTTYRQIERRICKATGFTRRQLQSRCRTRELTRARMAICYWTKRLTSLSYPQIGRQMDRDHTTVIHGVRRYAELRAEEGRNLKRIV